MASASSSWWQDRDGGVGVELRATQWWERDGVGVVVEVTVTGA